MLLEWWENTGSICPPRSTRKYEILPMFLVNFIKIYQEEEEKPNHLFDLWYLDFIYYFRASRFAFKWREWWDHGIETTNWGDRYFWATKGLFYLLKEVDGNWQSQTPFPIQSSSPRSSHLNWVVGSINRKKGRSTYIGYIGNRRLK